MIATTGAVVSSVKLERGGAGVAEAVGLARHDGVGAIGEPARGERPGPGGVSRHRGGDGAAVDAEVHHGAGKPGAAQRIVRGDVVAGRAAGVDGQRLRHRRTGGAQVEDHRAAAAGIAGGVGTLATMLWLPLPDSVTPVLQLPSLHHGGADRRGAAIVEERHRGAGVGHIHRAGDGLRRLVGGAAAGW